MIDELKAKVDFAFANNFNHTLHAYIDITGDLIAGTLLSQIIFWFMPDRNGNKKVRVIKENKYWLAKSRDDWYEEIRITPKQFDRASKILESKGFIEKKIFKFNGDNTVHVRPIYENIQSAIDKWKEIVAEKLVKSSDFPKGQFKDSPKGNSEIDEKGISLTEYTTLTSTEDTISGNIGTVFEGSKTRAESNNSYDGWGEIANEVVKRGKWKWQSLEQYDDYIYRVLPRYLETILKKRNKEKYLDFFVNFFRYFLNSYKENFGVLHPWYKQNVIESVIDDLDSFFGEDCYINDDITDYVDEFFKKGSLSGYEMKVFSSNGILEYINSALTCDFESVNPHYR